MYCRQTLVVIILTRCCMQLILVLTFSRRLNVIPRLDMLDTVHMTYFGAFVFSTEISVYADVCVQHYMRTFVFAEKVYVVDVYVLFRCV